MRPYNDENRNRIDDSLEIKITKDTSEVRVIVLFNRPSGKSDIDEFSKFGGTLTHGPWENALFGFSGKIVVQNLKRYLFRNSDIIEIVDDNEPMENYLNYASKQVRARYVWPTYGFYGDPETTIAIIDTGIDPSHSSFAPGYGELDKTKKIIGWRDFSTSGNKPPYDSDGHGSHCAGIAAGSGFTPLDSKGRIMGTDAFKSQINGNYIQWGQMIVDKPGEIEVEVAFDKKEGNIDEIRLMYGNNIGWYTGNAPDQQVNGWIEVACLRNLVGSDGHEGGNQTLNTLKYNVEPDKLGLYHVVSKRSKISNAIMSGLHYQVYLHWPSEMKDQIKGQFTGMAPDSKIVAIRSMYPSDWATSMDWCNQNKNEYHITVISISQGSIADNAAVHNAVVNTVNSGIVVCCAAGNGGAGKYNVSYPASVNEAIAVAAINGADGITSYSSQGGKNKDGIVKPDISGPGGSVRFQGGIWSVDSNVGNIPLAWGDDRLKNDGAPPQGTSQASPMVAGCAQILIQALGGWKYWSDPSELPQNKVLKVKQLLFLSCTETWPVRREPPNGPELSPTLERSAAKDPHEGYGRINLDAAVEACTEPLTGYVKETLFSSESAYREKEIDLEIPVSRHAFARHVKLSAGDKLFMHLDVPAEADFDLFLYHPNPDELGNPIICASGINSEPGGDEDIQFAAPFSGIYYVVVKGVKGCGDFTLKSEAGVPDIDSYRMSKVDFSELSPRGGVCPRKAMDDVFVRGLSPFEARSRFKKFVDQGNNEVFYAMIEYLRTLKEDQTEYFKDIIKDIRGRILFSIEHESPGFGSFSKEELDLLNGYLRRIEQKRSGDE